MTVLLNELDRIVTEIERQTRHSFMDRHVRRPEVPVSFVRVLHSMLRSLSISQERIRLYCVTATLLQMGLDIHETVTNARETGAGETRHRQLAVLAGDYMSSLFYKNLAEQGEINGVHRLSQAISDINEAKMELYGLEGQSQVSWSVFIQPARKICGGLVTYLSRFFYDDSPENPWDPLAGNLLLMILWSSPPRPVAELGMRFSEEALRPLFMETLQQVREIRPLEVRHDLIDLIRESIPNWWMESSVMEG
ncbi:heptaprenyl diphosphate synthase component 1 [Kroppenstedtia sanguinis]|uniref:Heptaprenyl diphosphate synthase component 1 n=1 Tax=Kroppenstedtia sanguinis TaxID=1380684 RepID=A0ABW4CB30_9BACL